MAEFKYRAYRTDGRLQSDCIQAASQDAALRALNQQGLTPIEIKAVTPRGENSARAKPVGRSGGASPARKSGRPGHEDVRTLTEELAIMLRSGLPLDRALKILPELTDKAAFVVVLEEIFKAVKSGQSLSQALQPHRALFGDFYINMVRSGEIGGQLPEVLARLAEHLERMRALRESISSALLYPAILVVVATVSVVMMLGFVVPQFESLFNDMGDALPLPTRWVLALGDLVTAWWWLLLAGAIVLFIGLRSWLRSEQGKCWLDHRLINLPILGILMRKFELTRFSRSLGTLLGAGVPIVQAIRISIETVGNQAMRTLLEPVGGAIKQGRRLTDALVDTGLFSSLAINMTRLGEETGRVDTLMLDLAMVYDREVQTSIKRTLTLAEPLLILGLGGAIAFIIIAILLGILSVNDAVF